MNSGEGPRDENSASDVPQEPPNDSPGDVEGASTVDAEAAQEAAFEEVWREIVDRFDGPPAPHTPSGPTPAVSEDNRSQVIEPLPEIDLDDPVLLRGDPLPAWAPAEAPVEETTFVPPTPSPMPPTTIERRIAWLTVLGAPALMMLLAITQFTPPRMISYALVAAFLAAFGYLIATMPDEPRDPWDDGSRV